MIWLPGAAGLKVVYATNAKIRFAGILANKLKYFFVA